MKKLLYILFACIIALLAISVYSPVASAHTTMYPGTQYQPYRTSGTVTTLQRSIRFHNNYVFSPTYITCRVYKPCVTIVNRTGDVVMLVNGYGRFMTKLWPGGSFNQMYFYPGTFYITDIQHNIRVPLTVTVLRGYSWQSRYTEQVYPIQRAWWQF